MDKKFALTAGQTALWLPQVMFPGKPVANAGSTVRIEGAFDPSLFAEAIRRLVEETDSLRLTVKAEAGTPFQEVRDYAGCALERIDVSAKRDPAKAAEQWVEEQYWIPIDWTAFPLFRFALIKLGADVHIWFFVHNHIILDAAARSLLIERAAGIYASLRDGSPIDPHLGSPLAARVEWEERYFGSKAYLTDKKYWAERFATPPDSLILGDRRATECAGTARPAQIFHTVGRIELELLEALATSLGTSLPRLFIALIYVAFCRLTRSQDLVIGFTLHNRIDEEFERTIGLLTSNLPYRIDIDPSTSLRDALRRIEINFLCDRSHMRFPVERLGSLIGWSRQERGLYDIRVNYLPAGRLHHFADAAVAITRLTPGLLLPWDVTLLERGSSGGLEISVNYDAGLVDADDAQRFAECVAFLATTGIADLDRPIGSLPIISDRTRRQMVTEANSTAASLPSEATLASLCADQAARTPRDVAILCGTETVDYATLHQRATILARRLVELGVGLDSVVGIALPRSIELVVAVLAIHKAGGAYLPLDPAYPAERIAYIVSDACVSLIVTTTALATTLPNSFAQLCLVDQVAGETAANDEKVEADDLSFRTTLRPDRLAYVLYTSGSTGRPKGVAVTHRNVVNLIQFANTQLDREDLTGVLFSTSLNFDLSTYEIFLPLSFGGRLILVEDLPSVATAPARDQVRLINTGPSLIEALLTLDCLPPGTRTINLAGEPLNRALADRIFAASPTVRLFNFYGPTETTVYSTWSRVDAEDRRAPAIGKGLWNTQLYVLDAGRELLPSGAKGELYIGGEGVARGYLNRPDLTEERFVANPFGPGRLYRTGDLVRWRSDGELEFLGREDTQVKIRGLRIELGEIEAHLAMIPGITAAVAIVRKDKFDVTRVYSYATATDAAVKPSFAEIEAHLARSLPRYMMPATHTWLDALPLTPNRKLDRHALPAPVEECLAHERIAPRNDTEQQIAQIWQDLLRFQDFGVRDDFFGIGGDSLMAIGLLLEIERRLGTRLPLDAVYGEVTIERQAIYLLSPASPEPVDVIVPLQPLGSKIPFFCVHGIGGELVSFGLLAKHIGTERPFFGIRAPDLSVSKDVLGTFETTAGLYVDAVLARQPVGPYYVGGYSLGATIAYEMALQLVQRGHRIGMLVLIDQSRPEWALGISNFIPTAVNFLRNLAPWFRYDLAYYGTGVAWSNTRRKLTGWLRALSRIGTPSPEPDISRILDLSRFAPDRYELFRVFYAALLAYKAKRYVGRVVVLRAAAQPIFCLSAEPGLGWREIIEPEPKVRIVPGNHQTITAEPNVRLLAAELRQCLDEADRL